MYKDVSVPSLDNQEFDSISQLRKPVPIQSLSRPFNIPGPSHSFSFTLFPIHLPIRKHEVRRRRRHPCGIPCRTRRRQPGR